jgi:ankyrin repeat protein
MKHILTLLLSVLILSSCSNGGDENTLGLDASPLVIAAEENRIDEVRKLLSEGQDVDARDDCDWTALMKASLYGYRQIVGLLLAHGASVNLVDSGGYSAMLLAASNNHQAVVTDLLDKGAYINHQEQTRGWTALIWAAKRGHEDTVRLLLQKNADKSLTDHEGKTALSWARESNKPAVARLLQ